MSDSAPQRLQLRRTKGFSLHALSQSINGRDCVKVDRTTKWGNPFVVGKPGGAYSAMVVDRRHAYLLFLGAAPFNETLVKAARAELRGKNLACWCPFDGNNPFEDVCHAAVLLKIANGDD